jgi:hypothetical protein
MTHFRNANFYVLPIEKQPIVKKFLRELSNKSHITYDCNGPRPDWKEKSNKRRGGGVQLKSVEQRTGTNFRLENTFRAGYEISCMVFDEKFS